MDIYYCIYTTKYVSWNKKPDLFNSGDDKRLPSWKYVMSHVFFQLNTTCKGKLIDPIESNSQMGSTYFRIHVQSYHSLVYQIFNLTSTCSMVP